MAFGTDFLSDAAGTFLHFGIARGEDVDRLHQRVAAVAGHEVEHQQILLAVGDARAAADHLGVERTRQHGSCDGNEGDLRHVEALGEQRAVDQDLDLAATEPVEHRGAHFERIAAIERRGAVRIVCLFVDDATQRVGVGDGRGKDDGRSIATFAQDRRDDFGEVQFLRQHLFDIADGQFAGHLADAREVGLRLH